MKTRHKRYDIVRVTMTGERVTVTLTQLPLTQAILLAERLDRVSGESKVFHDAVPAGCYKDGDEYEGHKR